MLWPLLVVLAVIALVVLHLSWRRNLLRSQADARTEIERLKEAQRESTVQLRSQQEALFNSMIEGLLLLDQSGRIQMANHAFATLFELQIDIRGKTILEALRLHELAELVESLGAGGEVLGHQLMLPPPSERWVQVNGAAILNGGGARQGTLLVFHDLTRLKKLERAREEFVANVSHELRTPLSLIKGYAETLLDGAKDNPEVATKFLQTIDCNAERLKLLIEDVLTISELESGRVKLNLQVVALRPVVDKVIDDLKVRAGAKSVRMFNQAPNVSLRADANRLEQVLGNLIDNAIKYG